MTKTILIVEDERPLRSAVEGSLTRNGFEVVSAPSAKGALDILNSETKISAIWLDHYLLGNETGLDVLYELKQHKDWKDIPVFAVTNSVGDDKVASYELLGIEKYFVKSNTSMNEIVDCIKAAC